KKTDMENILATFMNETRNRFNKDEEKLNKIENHVTQLATTMGAQMKNLETQIGQLAKVVGSQHQRGQFPSNTELNPKEQCQAIRLRSGMEYEGPKMPEEKESEPKGKERLELSEKEEDVRDELEKEPIVMSKKGAEKLKSTSNSNSHKHPVNLPFPQRFQKKNLDAQFAKFLDIFKKIHINIPFAEALEQMLNYAKFLKDVISKKRRVEDHEM
ncbi:Unknown protein, partial [Striga hermonthica]